MSRRLIDDDQPSSPSEPTASDPVERRQTELGTRVTGSTKNSGSKDALMEDALMDADTMLHVGVAGERGERASPRERAGDPEARDPEARAPEEGAQFPRPGSVLEGKYRLIDRIASSTMGSVWRAEHLALEVPVAIKLLRPTAEPDSDGSRRFLREARIASALGSPHVAQVLDYGMDQDRPYMVMELLRGESLARRLRRVGCLSPQQTAAVLVPLARALQRVHDLGVVHRDIKPDNVFIVQGDDREHPKLLDFGVAKLQKDRVRRELDVSVSRDTAEGEMVGTPHYMSPEQARGVTSVDHRSDVWALGVMAFECLLGYPPFVASGLGNLLLQICAHPPPVPSAFGAVPAGFDDWFARACARAPDARFPSVLAAATQLDRICAQGRLEGPRRPARATRWRGASRSPSRWWPSRWWPSRWWPSRWWWGFAGARRDRTLPGWFAAIAVVSLLCGAAARVTLGGAYASRTALPRIDKGKASQLVPARATRF